MKFKAKLEPAAMVRAIYRKLARAWGPQHWWPAETSWEVMVGAILTQNTSWTNVERALTKLREAGVLSLESMRELPLGRLEELIRSSGYFRQKATRLKNFVRFLDEKYQGSLEQMFAAPTNRLRAELLSLSGIGPETADAILLYAGNHEVFVVDAYARRIFERHMAVNPKAKYDEIRLLVEAALRGERRFPSKSIPSDRPSAPSPSPASMAPRSEVSQTFNEMHGLLVQTGKHYCHKREPDCKRCLLRSLLPGSDQTRK